MFTSRSVRSGVQFVRRILLESRTKEGDSPVFENILIHLMSELEYGGTREILSELAATMR